MSPPLEQEVLENLSVSTDYASKAHLKHLPDVFANVVGDCGRYSVFATSTRGKEIGGFGASRSILWELYQLMSA